MKKLSFVEYLTGKLHYYGNSDELLYIVKIPNLLSNIKGYLWSVICCGYHQNCRNEVILMGMHTVKFLNFWTLEILTLL